MQVETFSYIQVDSKGVVKTVVKVFDVKTNPEKQLLQEIFQSLEQGQVIKPESTFHYALKSIFNK